MIVSPYFTLFYLLDVFLLSFLELCKISYMVAMVILYLFVLDADARISFIVEINNEVSDRLLDSRFNYLILFFLGVLGADGDASYTYCFYAISKL